jgi:hypothetical protein
MTAPVEVLADKRKAQSADVTTSLCERAVEANAALDGDLAGYALVCWDRSGNAHTVYQAGGMIGMALIPTFAADALNRHVAVDLVRTAAAGDAGAD